MKRLLVVALTVVAAACKSRSAVPAAPVAPPAATQNVASETAVILPSGHEIAIEVASNEETRARGLMFRDSLEPDRGMLFLFPDSGVYPFWMKNTLIPLDMLWLDDAGKIVHITPNVPPCPGDPCPSFSPEVMASRVLELRAGRAAELGLKVGDVLRARGIERYRIE